MLEKYFRPPAFSMVYLTDKESCSHSDHMYQSDFVTFLLLKPLSKDPKETETGAAASRKSPGCWTATKVTLRLLFCLPVENNVDSKMNLYFHHESLGTLKVIYFVYHC